MATVSSNNLVSSGSDLLPVDTMSQSEGSSKLSAALSTMPLSVSDSTIPSFTSFTDELMSETIMSQYHTLVSQQAQAAAAMMILGPGSSAADVLLGGGVHAQSSLTPVSVGSHSLSQPVQVLQNSHLPVIVRNVNHKMSELLRSSENDPDIDTTQQDATQEATTTRSKSQPTRKSAKQRPADKYRCTQCTYTSRWSHALSNHMRTHNNTLFRCDQCEYSTPWKGDMTNHKRNHSGNLFKCAECDFKTYRKQGLEKHMRMHTGAKPFKCPHCSYESSQPGNLKKHMMRHTGEKPLACELCDYRCRQKNQLVGHMNQYHNARDITQSDIRCQNQSSKQTRAVNNKPEAWISKRDTTAVYSCKLCGYQWRSRQVYLKHMKTTHAAVQESLIPCDEDKRPDIGSYHQGRNINLYQENIDSSNNSSMPDHALPTSNSSIPNTTLNESSNQQHEQCSLNLPHMRNQRQMVNVTDPIGQSLKADGQSENAVNPGTQSENPINPVKYVQGSARYDDIEPITSNKSASFMCGFVCEMRFSTMEECQQHQTLHTTS